MEREQQELEDAMRIIDGVDAVLRELRQDPTSAEPHRRLQAAREIQGVIAAALGVSPIANTPRVDGRRKYRFDK